MDIDMTDNNNNKKSNLVINYNNSTANHQHLEVTSQPSQKHEILSFRKIIRVELFILCFSESLKCI